jgi:hypothetical protein
VGWYWRGCFSIRPNRGEISCSNRALALNLRHYNPFALISLLLGWRLLPKHNGENIDPVDHLGGILICFDRDVATGIHQSF